ncbi:unnamed protein product [marine sediment metagenome]|uniref:Uncharacterized protein n=1 Tax=marine sediment metagenome TaxID=412755 RepID=X1KUK4_9ZZZZ
MNMVIQNYNNLLGYELILYGFTLCSDGDTTILLYDSEAIKCWQYGKYNLETIKRYCRLYLRKIKDL